MHTVGSSIIRWACEVVKVTVMNELAMAIPKIDICANQLCTFPSFSGFLKKAKNVRLKSFCGGDEQGEVEIFWKLRNMIWKQQKNPLFTPTIP